MAITKSQVLLGHHMKTVFDRGGLTFSARRLLGGSFPGGRMSKFSAGGRPPYHPQ